MHSSKELLCPCNFTAIAQNESVYLKWNSVDDAEGYRVFILDDKEQQFSAIKYTSAPDKIIYALKNNREYLFKVKALDRKSVV